jgi:diguanylate cyclase (GGDEF)-like protein
MKRRSVKMLVGGQLMSFGNETDRLDALRSLKILDTPSDSSFDRLTSLGSRIFEVPICAISLVDADRQWFKSAIGLGISETSRAESFCDATIQSDDCLIVENAAADPRFADSVLVRSDELRVRFYAGVPLVIRGQRVGAFCIMDRVQRQFTESDEDLLRNLASTVVDQLKLHYQSLELLHQTRDLEAANDRLRFLANHDYLTGLLNRRGFLKRLEGLHANNTSYALLLIDLDNFKAVNDTSGHDLGDKLLFEVAARLSSVCSDKSALARLGGDEFALIVPDVAKPWSVVPFAQAVIEAFSAPFASEGGPAFLSASMGIALSPSNGRTPVSVLKATDLALYQSKEKGRGRFSFYSKEVDQKSSARRRLFDEARDGLSKGDFKPYYQPLIGLRSHAVCGFEALVRWSKPHRGLLTPGQFFEALQDDRLGTAISNHVLRSVVTQVGCWQKDWDVPPISVNLTAGQLRSPNFIESLKRTLSKSDVPHNKLKFEITENIVLDRQPETIIARVDELRSLGHEISLDDFGTGYASLTHLRSLPIDQLKIDISFVQSLKASRDSRAIVRSLAHLAHELRIEVACEGLEDAETASVAALLGCDVGQGYLFSKPMPANKVRGFFRTFEQQQSSIGLVVPDELQQQFQVARSNG